MTKPKSWCCKECGATLGWQDESGLCVHAEAIERFTVPSRTEEIWVTCGVCRAVQIWRARAELQPTLGGRWRLREKPDNPSR